MSYQYAKDGGIQAKEPGEDDPYALLLAKLSGISTSKPRKGHAFDLWVANNEDTFITAMQEVIAETKPTRFQLSGLRTKIKKIEFQKLSESTQKEWSDKVQQKYGAAIEEWKGRSERGASTTPEDRQRYVDP